MKKRSITVLILLAVVLLSTGCSARPDTAIDPSNGIWDKFFVYPLSLAMDFFADLFNNYGLAIIVVTIIIRFLILPLMVTQIRSSKAMQALQPEIKKIKEKYKDNQQKVQEETMKLFQQHNVNPLAGCFPILIQMPILIAFYHSIMRNQHIADSTFLWLHLGDKDPYYILPVVAAIATYFQTKLMGTGSVNAQGAQQQKIMTLVMPAMILLIGVNLPSALALYWVVGNIFTIVQTKLVKGIK